MILPEHAGPEVTWYLEAKAWSARLTDVDADQATTYAHQNGKRWVVLTNGQEWRLYDDHIRGLVGERLVATAELSDEACLASLLEAVSRSSAVSGTVASLAGRLREFQRHRAQQQRTAKLPPDGEPQSDHEPLDRPRRAFMVRMKPGEDWIKVDRVAEALRCEQIIIGWSRARNLNDPTLSKAQLRAHLAAAYSTKDWAHDKGKLSASAWKVWLFFREMAPGDLVAVPTDNGIYVAEITGPPLYDEERAAEDAAWRRPVRWLNAANPILRNALSDDLRRRLALPPTILEITAQLSDLLDILRATGSW